MGFSLRAGLVLSGAFLFLMAGCGDKTSDSAEVERGEAITGPGDSAQPKPIPGDQVKLVFPGKYDYSSWEIGSWYHFYDSLNRALEAWVASEGMEDKLPDSLKRRQSAFRRGRTIWRKRFSGQRRRHPLAKAGQQQVVEVGTYEELVANIRSNRRLLITADTLYLPDREREKYDQGIALEGLSNFALMSAGKRTALIYKNDFYPVFRVRNCRELYFKGLEAGHVDQGTLDCGAEGFVFDFEKCQDVLIRDCGMFGSGIVGLHVTDSRAIECWESRIYGCSQHAVKLWEESQVLLYDCIVVDNATSYSLFTLVGPADLWVFGSDVKHNQRRDRDFHGGLEYLFSHENPGARVLIEASQLISNQYDRLTDTPEGITISKGTGIRNNLFN